MDATSDIDTTRIFGIDRIVGVRGLGAFAVPGEHASIPPEEHQVQQITDPFKNWLLNTNSVYARMLQREKQEKEHAQRVQLQKEMAEQEQRQPILSKIKI